MSNGSRTASFFANGPLEVEGDHGAFAPIHEKIQHMKTAGPSASPHVEIQQPVAGGGGAAIGMIIRPTPAPSM